MWISASIGANLVIRSIIGELKLMFIGGGLFNCPVFVDFHFRSVSENFILNITKVS